MNILRLSLFNLKKNRKEAVAIAFLTMITTLMLGVFMANLSKSSRAFDDSFAASGSRKNIVIFEHEKYRDIYRRVLEEDFGATDIVEAEMINSYLTDVRKGDGGKISNNFWYITEKNERRIENFVKRSSLPDEKIAELSHPVWLPVYFDISEGCKAGDTFTIMHAGKEYPFEIAGFYETGMFASANSSFKCVISDNDYELFRLIFNTSGSSIENKVLYFNTEKDISLDDYINKCVEVSGENVKPYYSDSTFEAEKENLLQFINIFMYLLAFFSGITLLAALLMINHRISNDIEDQMQQIGVLEALGYRSREISLSYVFEYIICGGTGSILGAIAALLVSPAMNLGIQKMIGRTVTVKTDAVKIFIAALAVAAVVTVIALIKAAKVKKYPPVVAFRKGIKTHHFGRDLLPLEKMKGSINLTLAMKSFFGDIKSALGVAVCIIASGTAILFCANAFYLFKDGIDSMIPMAAYDLTADVTVMDGADPYKIRDEIAEMPEVRKALVKHQDRYLPVKGSEYDGATVIFGDFADAENIPIIRGRYPDHDNEIMVTLRRTNEDGCDIGDSIVLEGNGIECKYIVTGITSTMMNNGMGLYLTSDGYTRTMPDARPMVVSVYLADGVTVEVFEQRLNERFGTSAKNGMSEQAAVGSPEERIKAAADEKIAALLSQYGVTNVDYAVVIGDKVIKGNSRQYVIKNVSSYIGTMEQSLGGIAAVAKIGSFIAVIVLSVVVAVILGLIASSNVKRQRKSLGIMKGMGYSSKDLMTQLALKTMPVTVISVIISAVASSYVYSAFWYMVSGALSTISLPVTIATGIILVAFCYAVTYISVGRVKAISVTELMTE